MSNSLNPYECWLGLPAGRDRPNFFELLGLDEAEENDRRIATAADRASSRVRGFRPGPYAAQWAALLDEIAAAKQCLTDPARRQAYRQALAGKRTLQDEIWGSEDLAVHVAVEALLPPQAAVQPQSPPPVSPPRQQAPPVVASPPRTARLDPSVQVSMANRLADLHLRSRRGEAVLWSLVLCGLAAAVGGVVYLVQLSVRDSQEVAAQTAVENLRVLSRELAESADSVTAPSRPVLEPNSSVTAPTSVKPQPADPQTPAMAATSPDPAPLPREPEPAPAIPGPATTTTSTVPTPATNSPPITPPGKASPPAEVPVAKSTPDPAHAEKIRRAVERTKDAVSQHDFDRAAALLEAIAELPASPGEHQQIASLRHLVDYVSRYRTAIMSSVGRLTAGESFEVGSTTVIVVEVSPEKLIVRVAGRNRTYSLQDMPVGLAASLAARSLDEKAPESLAMKGAYVLVNPRTKDKDRQLARSYLEEAAKTLDEAQGILQLLTSDTPVGDPSATEPP